MLARRYRLTRPEDFHRVLRGKRWSAHHHLFSVSARSWEEVNLNPMNKDTPPEDHHPRVGVVVSKAVGHAVVRNKVKRRLRHAVLELCLDLPQVSLLVIRAHPAAAKATFAQLHNALSRTLDQLRAQRPSLGCSPSRKTPPVYKYSRGESSYS